MFKYYIASKKYGLKVILKLQTPNQIKISTT